MNKLKQWVKQQPRISANPVLKNQTTQVVLSINTYFYYLHFQYKNLVHCSMPGLLCSQPLNYFENLDRDFSTKSLVFGIGFRAMDAAMFLG